MLAADTFKVHVNPLLIGAAIQNQWRVAQAESRKAEEPKCAPHGYIYSTRLGCGHRQPIPNFCSDPLCYECEKAKAHERQARWLPTLKRMSTPRLITFTIPNGFDPKERLVFLQKSFRALLELRIGKANLDYLCERALLFSEKHYLDLANNGTIDQVEAANRIAAHTNSIRAFRTSIINAKAHSGKWSKMRKLIGPGFATLETTWHDETGYHFHRHLCTDGRFIPWAFLCVTWLKVTGDQASITDIRAIDKADESIKELAKYVTKGWEIPPSQHDILRAALKRVKRIWPLGGAKPEQPDRSCPYCGDPTCHAKMGGKCSLIEIGELAGVKYQVFETEDQTPTGLLFFVVYYTQDGGRGEFPLLDTLSDCAPPGREQGSCSPPTE